MAGDFDDDIGPTRVIRPGAAAAVRAVSLTVIDGPDRGASVVVQRGKARVGTAERNDLRLTDPTVSRHHVEISTRGAAIAVRDLGSTNGTFLQGVRVRDCDAPPGSLVRVGATTMRIEAQGDGQPVEVSPARSFGPLVGSSVEMRQIYALLERAAPTATTVLVQGETGTGKELVAQALHDASPRARGPFVAIDCGALPEHLIESELFGHVRGAFTGAVSDRRGVFEEANGGTLFLDEVGEMPISLQPKLLRALETRTVRRVGSNKTVPFDVRLVAATNRRLDECVNEGRFRSDLYFRLAVIEIELPPLRARRDDAVELARLFHERFAAGKQAPASLLDAVASRPWPGNVRELRNFVERAVSLGWSEGAPSPPPALSALPPGLEQLVPLHLPLKEARLAWMASFEAIYVQAMLAKTAGNVTRAAELAGVSRRFLQRLKARIEGRVDDGEP